MTVTERKALVRPYLGKTVTIKIDRPIGYIHKKDNYSLTYPINYGYIPGVLGGDGEELDVYLLGVDVPISDYTGKIIGIVYRKNDVEDKLVMAPEGVVFTQNEINQKKVNLLFFGNFFRMSLDDYTSGMLQMMDDRDYLYRSLIKDVYSQGVVLGSKYRRLRISYNVFMYGLIAATISFAIAALVTL